MLLLLKKTEIKIFLVLCVIGVAVGFSIGKYIVYKKEHYTYKNNYTFSIASPKDKQIEMAVSVMAKTKAKLRWKIVKQAPTPKNLPSLSISLKDSPRLLKNYELGKNNKTPFLVKSLLQDTLQYKILVDKKIFSLKANQKANIFIENVKKIEDGEIGLAVRNKKGGNIKIAENENIPSWITTIHELAHIAKLEHTHKSDCSVLSPILDKCISQYGEYIVNGNILGTTDISCIWTPEDREMWKQANRKVQWTDCTKEFKELRRIRKTSR